MARGVKRVILEKVQILKKSPARQGYIFLIASSVVFSFNGIFVKVVLRYFEPNLIAFWRVLLVALALGIALLIQRRSLLRVERRHVLLFAALGAVGVGMQQMFWIVSVQLNGVSIATMLVYLSPAIVAVFSWRFLKEALGPANLFALALSLGGMVMVSRIYEVGDASLNWLGILIGVGTSATWASYSLLGRFATANYSPWTVLFYAFSFGALFLLLFWAWGIGAEPANAMVSSPFNTPLVTRLLQIFPGSVQAQGWMLLILLALGTTLGGFTLYTIGLSCIPASVASLIGMLEPVLSIILAFFFFGEVLNLIQGVGAVLILTSVVMLTTGRE